MRGKKAKKTKVTLRFAQTMTASEKKKKKIPGKISFFYGTRSLEGVELPPLLVTAFLRIFWFHFKHLKGDYN